MGMVIKRYKLFILSIIMMLSTSAYAGDLNTFYQQDYDGFWKYWNESKSEAVACDSERKTKLFFSDALITLGNSEVTEANARVIETVALNNPKCLLNAMNTMNTEAKQKFLRYFLVHPLFGDAENIERALSNVWNSDNHRESRQLFMKLKGT